MTKEYHRGDIWYANLNITDEETEGIISKIRPILIISNDRSNYSSPIVTGLAISRKCKKETHIKIDCLTQPSWIQPEQIFNIAKSKMVRKVTNIGTEILEQVDMALDIHLDKSVEVFNIGTAFKYLDIIKTMQNFLDENIDKLNSTFEIENSIQFQEDEFIKYCKKFGVDYNKIINKKRGSK